MDFREVLTRNCEQLGSSRVTVRKKSALAILDILNDQERKKQLIQLEILFPANSFLDDLLNRFAEVIKFEKERTTKKVDTSCSQLFFSFAVMLSENNYVLQKYADRILGIVLLNLQWAITSQDQSTHYLLNVCNILFSNSSCYPWMSQRTLLDLIKLVSNAILNSELSDGVTRSTAIQCLIEYWRFAAFYINRNDVQECIEQLYAILNCSNVMTHVQRSQSLSCLSHFVLEFPTECASIILGYGEYSVRILKELCIAGQIDDSILSCFPFVMFVCSLPDCPLSFFHDTCSLIELVCIPHQQSFSSNSRMSIPLSSTDTIAQGLVKANTNPLFKDSIQHLLESLQNTLLEQITQLETEGTLFHLPADVNTLISILHFTVSLLHVSLLTMDASSLIPRILGLLNSHNLKATIDCYTAFLCLLKELLITSTHSTRPIVLSIIKQLSHSLMSLDDVLMLQFDIVSNLLLTSEMEMRQIWFEDLSPTEQVFLLSSCMLRVSYATLPSSFSSVLQLLVQWTLRSPSFDSLLQCICDRLLPQVFKISSSPLGTLNSRQVIHQEIQFDGCLSVFCELISVLCGAKLTVKCYDASLSEYATKYEKLLRDEGIPVELFQTRFIEITDFSNHPQALKNLSLLRSKLEEIVKDECKRIKSELSTLDCTDDVYSRFLLCGQVWQLVLQLFKSEPEPLQSLSDLFGSLIMQIDIHSQQGGRVWGYYLQLSLFSIKTLPSASLLKPFQDFFGLLNDRILTSRKLILFDTPGVNDGFRYNLATSINNSDMILVYMASVNVRRILKNEVHITDYDTVVHSMKEWLEDMPYRHLLRISLYRLTQSFLEQDDPSMQQTGISLLQQLLAVPDSYGVGSSYFFSILSHSSSLQTAFQSIQDTVLSPFFLQSTTYHLQYHALFLIIHSFYPSLDRNTQMRILLLLEKTVMLSSSLSLCQYAKPILMEIASMESQQPFVQSFTVSLLKKSWNTHQLSYQAMIELLQVLSSSLPSLLSISLCCMLQGAQGSLSSSQSLIAAAGLAKIQFYSLQDTSFIHPIREVISSPLAERFALAGMIWELIQQEESSLSPLLQSIGEHLKVSGLASSVCDETYPLVAALQHHCNTDKDLIIQSMTNLMPTLCVIEYSEEMNLELRHVSDSLRNDVKSSLCMALQSHKEQIQIDQASTEVLNWGICELLEPAETQIQSIDFLQSILLFDSSTQNSQYISSFIQTLLCLMDRCSSWFSNRFVTHLILSRLQCLASNVSRNSPLLDSIADCCFHLLTLEESLWHGETEYLNISQYASLFDTILNQRDDWKRCAESWFRSTQPNLHGILCCVKTALPVLVMRYKSLLITLLTTLQKDYVSHWECVTLQLQRIITNFIQTQMMTIRVMEKDDLMEGSQSLSTPDTSDLLLDNSTLRQVIIQSVEYAYSHADVVTATEGQRMFEALRTLLDLNPENRDLLSSHVVVETENSSHTHLFLSLFDSIAFSLLHDTPSPRWIESLSILQKVLNHKSLTSMDQSQWINHPLLLSLRIHQSERSNSEVSHPTIDPNENMTQEVPLLPMNEVPNPSSSDTQSVEAILRYLLHLCSFSLFAPFLSILEDCFSTQSIEGRMNQSLLMTLLVYEALQHQYDIQIGVLMRLALSSNEQVQRITLHTLTYLHRFIYDDYSHHAGLFISDSPSDTNTSSSSKRSRPSQSNHESIVLLNASQTSASSFPSPVDCILVRLQLPLTLIIDAASSLHKPMTSLLWTHSVTLPFTPEDTHIYSWNTIVTYPSVVSHTDSGSDDEDESEDMADKRLCKNQSGVDIHTQPITEQLSSLIDMKSLNSQIVNSYLEAGNPYAALAITQSGQTSQQMMIQCETQRCGFAGALEDLSAYASLIGESNVLQQSLSSLGVTDLFPGQQKDLWMVWPWRQLTQWGRDQTEQYPSEGVSSLLLEYEQQISHPLNSLIIPSSWYQKSERILSNEFLEMLQSEKITLFQEILVDAELLKFVTLWAKDTSIQPDNETQRLLQTNLLLLRGKRGSDESAECYLSVLESLLEQMTQVNIQTHHERCNGTEELSIVQKIAQLRYKLQLINSCLVGSAAELITDNHRSLLQLETAKVLYRQGFIQLAVSMIRSAEHLATTSLVSGTCRLEELLLTSANEDESRRLNSVQAMYSLLRNDEDEAGMESMTHPLQANHFISSICNQKRSYLTLASLTNDLLKRLQGYFESSEYNQMETTMSKIRQELEILSRRIVSTHSQSAQQALNYQKREKEVMLKEFQEGPNAPDKIESRLNLYRKLTLELCLQGIQKGEQNSADFVYMFVSLWFKNIQDKEIELAIQKYLLDCPLAVFVPLAHQIVSRIGQDNPLLTKFVKRLTEMYPYHLVPFLLPIVTEKNHLNPSKRECLVISILSSLSESISPIYHAYYSLFSAYHSFILADHSKLEKNVPIPLPNMWTSSSSLRVWSQLPVLTATLPILPLEQLKRQSIPFIHSFGSSYQLVATGITSPLRVTCVAHDGSNFNQILKNDEIRSDCVVQQLFELLNRLLAEKNIESQNPSYRDIHLRIYRIISITSKTGVIEFVPNSTPIRDYLVSDSRQTIDTSAHARYHPGEITNHQIMKQAATLKARSAEERIQFYHSITKQFTPVLHYFFLERFFAPQQWYQNTHHFVSTLSVNSIVGYIVGLGDRHLRNILIDNKTGELVHIDFGILFERGRILCVPERVPFRLTREFVDCLGVEGVDGLMREQMEYCMKLVSEKRELILTILEVFLHDPLNSWVVRNRDENAMVDGANTSAEQVLFKIENKLLGRDNQNTESIGVEKQVDVLIKQATNENNLALMFHGWGAWL